MNWADAEGVSYLAWGWWVLGTTSTRCSALGDPGDDYDLISNYDGAAASPDGTNLHAHLAALVATPALQVTTASLPAGTEKQKYSVQLTASGGNPPYKWSLASGHLPAGLHIKAAGLITGKPRAAGTYTFTVKVLDHKTRAKPHTQRTASRPLSVTVGAR